MRVVLTNRLASVAAATLLAALLALPAGAALPRAPNTLAELIDPQLPSGLITPAPAIAGTSLLTAPAPSTAAARLRLHLASPPSWPYPPARAWAFEAAGAKNRVWGFELGRSEQRQENQWFIRRIAVGAHYARFYDPQLGRFLSHDPVDGDLTNPPSLHKYLYAFQNPTVFVDPDGRMPDEAQDDDFERTEFTEEELDANFEALISGSGPEPETEEKSEGFIDKIIGFFSEKPKETLVNGQDAVESFQEANATVNRALGAKLPIDVESMESLSGTIGQMSGTTLLAESAEQLGVAVKDAAETGVSAAESVERASLPFSLASLTKAIGGGIARLFKREVKEEVAEAGARSAARSAVASADDVLSSAARPARGGSQDSRGLQALKKKIDREDDAFAGLTKSPETAEAVIRQVLSVEEPIVKVSVRNGRTFEDIFDPASGRGVRLIDGVFDTFVNLEQ